jgi:hypothetical protein
VWELWRNWRDQNPKIVKFWDKLEQATVDAVANPRRNVACSDGVLMQCVGRYLFMQLPSGGRIVYPYPRIINTTDPRGKDKRQVVFRDSANGRWSVGRSSSLLLRS